MRRSIYLYLFLFAALWVVFQYVYSKNYSEKMMSDLAKEQRKVERVEAVNDSLQNQLYDIRRFTLGGNDRAREYHRNDDVELSGLPERVQDALIESNLNSDNTDESKQLIPYVTPSSKPWRFNAVQLLNHRLLIAEFTNGDQWGEVILKYFVDGEVIDFEPVDGVLYIE